MKHLKLISWVLPYSQLWYGEPNALSQRNCVCAAGHILP